MPLLLNLLLTCWIFITVAFVVDYCFNHFEMLVLILHWVSEMHLIILLWETEYKCFNKIYSASGFQHLDFGRKAKWKGIESVKNEAKEE